MPPVAKLPSTVKSGISNTLYVMNTPIAIIPQINPKDKAAGKDDK